jgi:hypothetical protein
MTCGGIESEKARAIARVIMGVQDVGVSSAGTQTGFFSHCVTVHVTNCLPMVKVRRWNEKKKYYHI